MAPTYSTQLKITNQYDQWHPQQRIMQAYKQNKPFS